MSGYGVRLWKGVHIFTEIRGGGPDSDADLTKNMDGTGESSACSLVHRDKVRYPIRLRLYEPGYTQEL
ncbi:hypothetical protein AVEN_104838-1 [Araneus ventricosus]|uniref:Uncharacterized protein n=1 Tax=Araneus ventricosus TaxID=182803 RepID=A0A4Y2UAU7_ARAVE|nr:hypothetical protein AVEN_104838-1 [Araneus ventricosus]